MSFLHFLFYNGVVAKPPPRTAMPNNNNHFLFIRIFLGTNYLKEQPSFANYHS